MSQQVIYDITLTPVGEVAIGRGNRVEQVIGATGQLVISINDGALVFTNRATNELVIYAPGMWAWVASRFEQEQKQ